MTPLQVAAKAAKNKLGLKECKCCGGSGEVREWICGETERDTCPDCGGGGTDTSNPDALTGTAFRFLSSRGKSMLCAAEPIPGGTEGMATALLRLVAGCDS